MEKENPIRIRADYRLLTHPLLLSVRFFIGSMVVFYICGLWETGGSDENWKKYFLCGIVWFGTAFYVLKWTRATYFTEKGLEICWFSWVLRSVSWDEIIQAGIVKECNAAQRTIAFTPVSSPAYQGDMSATQYVERYCFRFILMDATKGNLEAARKCYGEMDYRQK